jgi:hypothetical protein
VLDVEVVPNSAAFELTIDDLESQLQTLTIARGKRADVRLCDVGKVSASG